MTDTSPVLPILKSHDWLGRERTICRLLVPDHDLPGMPVVAYGYDRPHTFEFLLRAEGSRQSVQDQARLVEQAALRNLRARPAKWAVNDVRVGTDNKKLRLAAFDDDYLAAERILDSDFILQAHKNLKAPTLAVGVPRRGGLLAADGRPADKLSWFAAIVADLYYRNDAAPITPLVFLMEEGRITGALASDEKTQQRIVEHAGEEQAKIFVDTRLVADESTGMETLYVFGGGEDFDKLRFNITAAFSQGLMEAVKRDSFGGAIHVVIAAELTPDDEALPGRLASLEEQLNSIVRELARHDISKRPLSVTVERRPVGGQPEQ